MKVYGLTERELRDALDQANEEYAGNLRFNREPELFSRRNSGYLLTLRVEDSAGAGAKTGPSGRRTVSATYYAHREFMACVFVTNPDARIITAMERYDGLGEFMDKAPAVGARNVGSQMYPQRYDDQ